MRSHCFNRRQFGTLLTGASCVAVATFSAPAAWARAGGGESFGGEYSGNSRFGWLIHLLVQAAVEYPIFGVPLLIFIIAATLYAAKKAHGGYVSRTIRRGEALQSRNERTAALAMLKSRDAQFDEPKFLDRVSRAFLGIQEAWSRQDLASVRAFISDGIRERFSLQFQMQQALGYRNQLDGLQLRAARAVAIGSDPHFDTIHVEFHAQSRDYRVDLKSARKTAGESAPHEFLEYWSFCRRHGATTHERPGSLEGHCPQCGAPLEMTDVAQCGSCKSTVNSGQHDWVLAEITQSQEWSATDDVVSVSCLGALKEADPAFCVQHVEDRVSVMFWRLRAAEFFRDLRYVAPVALSEFSSRFLPSGDGVARNYWDEVAIGAVELQEFRRDEAGFDRLSVGVRWSGALCEGDPLQAHRQVRAKAIRSNVFELVRKAGVVSQLGGVFTSASCAQCGGPIALTSEAACGYCGAVLNDGSYDWTLDRVSTSAQGRAPDRRNDRQPQREIDTATRGDRPHNGSNSQLGAGRVELSMALLARIVMADGHCDPREREALATIGTRRGLSPEQLKLVLNTAADEGIELPLPGDRHEAAEYLQQMVEMSLADGNVSAQELKLLIELARRLNLSPEEVRLEIARQRNARFQAAKGILRQNRRR